MASCYPLFFRGVLGYVLEMLGNLEEAALQLARRQFAHAA
jgi:hypothetical protein